MRILYKLLNPMISTVLRYPLHGLLSRSIMLITMTGRKSGKTIATPVRYVRRGELILCFTVRGIRWWHNLRGGAKVSLLIQRKTRAYHARVLENDLARCADHLRYYFAKFPRDTLIYGVRHNRDGSLNEKSLARAMVDMVVIEFTPEAAQ